MPATIGDVIARMEAIDASLPRKDGVAYFNRLYLAVTRAVLAASSTTTFRDPGFVMRLDVVFAGYYFDAVAAPAPGPVAWRPLFEERAAAREPIQFALAGMNAHINHDLALAVVASFEALGLELSDGAPQHADYEQVNELLRSVEGQVAGWFESGLIADLEDVTPKDVDRALAMWSIVAARELAWEHAEIIWALRAHGELQRAYIDVLARTTELAGRAMLV